VSEIIGVRIHPTALVESDEIGEGTSVWAFVHIMPGARIGRDCNIGDHTYIEGGSSLGNGVTVKNGNMIWDGVTIADGVFVGPGVVFTNDRNPRSSRAPASGRGAPVRDWLLPTWVDEGASLGAGSVILPGVTIGSYALVAAGAVVTRDVAPYALVRGNPARRSGWVCRCGWKLQTCRHSATCEQCGRSYRETDGRLQPVVTGE
jgi:acetyltransferase-like isoleucine patch superfamily enzyme